MFLFQVCKYTNLDNHLFHPKRSITLFYICPSTVCHHFHYTRLFIPSFPPCSNGLFITIRLDRSIDHFTLSMTHGIHCDTVETCYEVGKYVVIKSKLIASCAYLGSLHNIVSGLVLNVSLCLTSTSWSVYFFSQ